MNGKTEISSVTVNKVLIFCSRASSLLQIQAFMHLISTWMKDKAIHKKDSLLVWN